MSGCNLAKYYASLHLSSNGNLDLDTGLDVDDDLLHDLGGGSQTVILLLLANILFSLSAASARVDGQEGVGVRTQ